MPMSTRGSDRIAQLISSTWYNNIASGVMADIVQKHLSTEKELENTDNHLSTEKEQDKTGKGPGEIMRDIENQLMVERETHSDDTPTAAVDKTTIGGDMVATQEPLVIDIEKHLFVQREPHSNDELAVAAKKTTIVGDTLATQEPLMIDIEKHLFVQGEPHTNDESAFAAKKTTFVGDILATQEPLIMADIEEHLMVEREKHSNDTATAVVGKTTILGDTLATQEPLKDTDADLIKSFEEYKETFSRIGNFNNDRIKTIDEVMRKFMGSVDINVEDLIGKNQDQDVNNKDSDKMTVSSDIGSQVADENASIALR